MTGMADNAELLERFYAAFKARDGDAMAACYAPNARFSDPVFPDLRGSEPGAMWRMLTSGEDSDLRVELLEREADETTGSARWVAYYTFPETGRKVENRIKASFRFAGGLIVEHRDEFSFYRWARQALGPPGLLLGWTPLLRAAVRRRTRKMLADFIAGKTERG
jgi:ketosteroid isomerase-like protein